MSSVNDPSRKALGKGLSALLPSRGPAAPGPVKPPIAPAAPVEAGNAESAAVPTPPAPMASPAAPEVVTKLAVTEITPNPLQPRSVFDQNRLEELAASITANGIIQPIIVQKTAAGYQLVAGERRWRAAQLAGLAEVPVVVQNFADDRLLEVALIENIQREDLNPIEVAVAMEKLASELHISHEEIGKRTGKDRSTITNLLRLLRLPGPVQLLVAEKQISMGHARAILGLPTEELQRDTATKVVNLGLSVRQVEQMVAKMTKPASEQEKKEEPPIDPNVKAAIDAMMGALGTKVSITERSPGKGKIEIDYYSQADLDRIYSIITGEALD